jgi:DNA polymerase-3 subunit epsilon
MFLLHKPIVFGDFETTGKDTQKDRIIEYSFCKINIDRTTEIKTGKLNPGMPIPTAATEIHGITDADVASAPTFANYAKGIMSFIEDCDLAGFNSNSYDWPLLYAEFSRVNIEWDHTLHRFIDAGNIFKIQEPRTLSAAYKFYCGKDLEGAHSAEHDILATVEVLQAQIKRYSDLPQTIEELELYSNFGKKRLDLSGMFSYGDDGTTIYFTRGKYSGKIATIDANYLKWIFFDSNFAADTKRIARSIYDSIPFK